MDGLDPAISYPHQCPNDAVPVSDYSMQMAGSSHWLDPAIGYP